MDAISKGFTPEQIYDLLEKQTSQPHNKQQKLKNGTKITPQEKP